MGFDIDQHLLIKLCHNPDNGPQFASQNIHQLTSYVTINSSVHVSSLYIGRTMPQRTSTYERTVHVHTILNVCVSCTLETPIHPEVISETRSETMQTSLQRVLISTEVYHSNHIGVRAIERSVPHVIIYMRIRYAMLRYTMLPNNTL